MIKTCFSLVLLALGSGAACAQSAVNFYGVMDLGLSVDGGGLGGSATRVTSGMATQSRWGFRGSEELGNGMSAFFVLEGGIHADKGDSTQNNTLFGRAALVGLRGRYGALSIGLQDTPLFTTLNVVVDPLRNGIIRSNNLMAPTGFRAGNSVLYRSPDFSGFSGDLMYVPGEVAGDSAAARAWGGSLGYSRGRLNARVAYHRRNNDTAIVKGSEDARNTLVGANYDFGPLRAHLGYELNRGPGSSPLNNTQALFGGAAPVASTDSRDLLLAASMPLGASTVVASYVRKDDRTRFDQDARQLGLAYMYAFSKRSDVYTSFARIHNLHGAAYTEGNSEEAGTGDRQFTLGLRHRF
ncbi:porin [Massilia sp. Mn16-1_5]|uniref:porin n=1 Tax=Massilia sp. Mn16-1_5 TaxID=2079199 RepID=UPI00109E53E7|nr:porin [Massilia sp. Mn16-1_5]THC42947.1 porin [Massilia sp. Mn16-1_5]